MTLLLFLGLFAAGKQPALETILVTCFIQTIRMAGRCEHLTLPSFLMGMYCVLTFQFPWNLPSLADCFPSLCYLKVRARELTLHLKHSRGNNTLKWCHPCFCLPCFILKCSITCLLFPLSLFFSQLNWHSYHHCFKLCQRGHRNLNVSMPNSQCLHWRKQNNLYLAPQEQWLKLWFMDPSCKIFLK